jgi:flagellar biosynthesis/type III secretory pathway chaperone
MTESDPIAALGRLLKDERKALLSGDLAALPALIADKERLLDALADVPLPNAPALERLRNAAKGNQRLLDAALKGVRTARARLETARSGGPALSTYNARGQAESHGTGQPSVERRA